MKCVCMQCGGVHVCTCVRVCACECVGVMNVYAVRGALCVSPCLSVVCVHVCDVCAYIGVGVMRVCVHTCVHTCVSVWVS